jgi:hypothetical protein
VLDAAAACGATQDALFTVCSTELFTLSGGGQARRQALKALSLTAERKLPMKFKADVLEDLYCFRRGQVVNVELDLFEKSRMGLNVTGQEPLWLDVSLSQGRQLRPAS